MGCIHTGVVLLLLCNIFARSTRVTCKHHCTHQCNRIYQQCFNDAPIFCNNESVCTKKERAWCIESFCPLKCFKRCRRIKPKRIRIGSCKTHSIKCSCKPRAHILYKKCMKEHNNNSTCAMALNKKKLCMCALCMSN